MGTLWTAMKDWLGCVWAPYLLFGASVAALLTASAAVPAGTYWPLLVLVFGAGVWLQAKQAVALNLPNAQPARLALAVIQLVVSLLLFVLSSSLLEERDLAFFLGLIFSLLAVSAFASAARYYLHAYGWFLFALACLLLVVAMFAGSWWYLALATVGLIVGELATELTSATLLAKPPKNWWLIAGGALVVLSAVWMVTIANVAVTVAALVVLAIAIAVSFAVLDTDYLFLVLVIGAALVWATAHAQPADQPEILEPSGDAEYFLVLGDSYISGEGAQQYLTGTNTKVRNDLGTNECRQAPTSWPFVLARERDSERPAVVPNRLVFLGCSGAVTENIHQLPRLNGDGERRGPPELAWYDDRVDELGLTSDPKFIILSVGGNDASFGLIGRTCIGPGDCSAIGGQFVSATDELQDDDQSADPATAPKVDDNNEALDGIDDDLEAAYSRVEAKFPGIPVVVSLYPIPVDPDKTCDKPIMTRDEQRFAAGFTAELNDLIRSVADRHRFNVIDDMESSFIDQGLGLCPTSKRTTGLNTIDFNPVDGPVTDRLQIQNWIHNSLHPDEDGHAALAKSAASWFAAATLQTPQRELTLPVYAVRPAEEFMHPPVTACSGDACTAYDYAWLLERGHVLLQRMVPPLAAVTLGLWALWLWCLNQLCGVLPTNSWVRRILGL